MKYLIDFYAVKNDGKDILIDENVEFEGDIRYFFPLGAKILSNGKLYRLNEFFLEVDSRHDYEYDIQSKFIKLNAILEDV